MKKRPETLRADPHQYRQTWPFFVVLTLFNGFGAASSLMERTNALGTTWVKVLFVLLLVVLTVLYWVSPLLLSSGKRLIVFCLVQGSLTFTIGILAQGHWIVLALYGGLVGMAAAWFSSMRSVAVLAMAISLAFFALTLGVSWRGLNYSRIIPAVLVMLVLVCVYVYQFVRQLDAKVKAQQLLHELENAHKQLQEYADKVEELSVSKERERMAIELHDTLVQGVAGLTLQLEAIDAHLEQGELQRARELLSSAMQRSRVTQDESRRAVRALLPSALEKYGLVEACRREVEQLTVATGIRATFASSGELDDMPAQVAGQLLRVLQESLSNAARHAVASEVQVTLTCNDAEIKMVIADDGIGFDATREYDGLGLPGMRDRAEALGGGLEVTSAPGEGSTVSCTVARSRR